MVRASLRASSTHLASMQPLFRAGASSLRASGTAAAGARRALATATKPTAAPAAPVVRFEDIARAHGAIRSGVKKTPCVQSYILSDITGMRVYVKKEIEQFTGSFKERGARNALLSRPDAKGEWSTLRASEPQPYLRAAKAPPGCLCASEPSLCLRAATAPPGCLICFRRACDSACAAAVLAALRRSCLA